MRPLSLERRQLLDSLVREYLQHYKRGRTLLAVDGLEGSGAEQFAADLATRMAFAGHGAFHASLADFQLPQKLRLRRGDTADASYRDRFDYDQLRRVLIEPFRMGTGAGFVLKAFDAARDEPQEMEWESGPKDSTLVVSGPFLQRPELRGLWHMTIWVEAGSALPNAPEALYIAEASPRTSAAIIVDASDPQVPRRIFADSC